MDAKRFLEEARRMCKYHEANDCEGCPAADRENCQLDYTPLVTDNLEKMIEAVEKWSKEHPRKTRLQDFLEKYPNAPLDGNGIPCLMPWSVGYCGDEACYACEKTKVKTMAWCWEQEVEDDEAD